MIKTCRHSHTLFSSPSYILVIDSHILEKKLEGKFPGLGQEKMIFITWKLFSLKSEYDFYACKVQSKMFKKIIITVNK